MDIENWKPHRPTFMSTLLIVLFIFLIYHFTFGRKG